MATSQRNTNLVLLITFFLAALLSDVSCGWRPCLMADISNHRYAVSDISMPALKSMGYFLSTQWKNEDGKPIHMSVSQNYEMEILG